MPRSRPWAGVGRVDLAKCVNILAQASRIVSLPDVSLAREVDSVHRAHLVARTMSAHGASQDKNREEVDATASYTDPKVGSFAVATQLLLHRPELGPGGGGDIPHGCGLVPSDHGPQDDDVNLWFQGRLAQTELRSSGVVHRTARPWSCIHPRGNST